MKKATLVYIVDDDEVLMAKKVRKIGTGFFFGYGGKKNWWETAKGSAIREVWSESGGKKNNRCVPSESGGIKIQKKDLEPFALIDFYNGNEVEVPFGDPSFRVICYRVKRFIGKAIDTMEMRDATWFPVDEVPYDDPRIMKPGDELFVPKVIKGIPVKGWIRFNKKTNALIAHDVKECLENELRL
jgi:hypothetical protein